MSEVIAYQIGKGFMNRIPIWVGYKPAAKDIGCPEAIAVALGEGRHSEDKCLPARGILAFRPHVFTDVVIAGRLRTSKIEQGPPGWFQRKCREADCEWFVPMVERMADGEDVSLEEIQASYHAHNRKPMACGKWSEVFR